jgi:DNA-directed RNA polymerase subunit A"
VKFKDAGFRSLRNSKEKLKKIVVSGVKGISDVLPTTRDGEYIIQTFGSNLKAITGYEGVDVSRTTSNDLYEVAKVLGIEAARNTIVSEILMVLDKQGLDIDIRHVLLIADTMCKSGTVEGITRHGVTAKKSSVLARASFEIPLQHLVNASMFGEVDRLSSVVENVMINQPIPVGTGLPGLVVKMDDKKAGKTRKSPVKKK